MICATARGLWLSQIWSHSLSTHSAVLRCPSLAVHCHSDTYAAAHLACGGAIGKWWNTWWLNSSTLHHCSKKLRLVCLSRMVVPFSPKGRPVCSTCVLLPG